MGRLLAFIDIYVENSQIDEVMNALSQLPNTEEVYKVSGGGRDIVSLVSASDMVELRELINNKILRIKGVKGRVSSIALASHKKHVLEAHQSIARATF
jgi:DNA-binding Lrp family transcriptional regulator